MTIIDANILEKYTELLSKVNSVVKNLPLPKKYEQPHCHICSKMYVSKSGLSRYARSKDPENLPPNEKLKYNLLNYSLFNFLLKSFCKKCAVKLAEDTCYFEDVTREFRNF